MAISEPIEAGDGARRRLRLRNPATLEPLGEIELASPSDVRAAVERARKAQPGWAELSFAERGRYMQRAVRVLLERRDELVRTIVRDTGKAPFEALSFELLPACDALTYYARRARRILADRTPPPHLIRGKKLRIIHVPRGVVGIITPWNYPFVLALNPTVQALMAGNAVVLKPSEVAPFAGRLLADLFESVGLPEGVFHAVVGDGEAGAALLEADVDMISFTGSAQTGRRVAEACGRRLLPCSLELGGKDPMIVCADADLERASSGAVWGAFANSGQTCMSVERVYVVDDVADAFVARVLRKTAELRQGGTGDFDVGAISWPAQLDVIERHVSDAIARGARLLAGGRRNPSCQGLFYEPTVLVDVTQEMAVMREETCGPVMPIARVADEAEAVRLANDSSYGLNASVWTRNKHKGLELARGLESGCAVVNDCMVTYGLTESPFGGVKQSGLGRINGDAGLRGFCDTRSIVVDRFGRKTETVWYPYSAKKYNQIGRLMRFVWGTPLGRFLS